MIYDETEQVSISKLDAITGYPQRTFFVLIISSRQITWQCMK